MEIWQTNTWKVIVVIQYFSLFYVMMYFTMTPIALDFQLKLRYVALLSNRYYKSVKPVFLHNDKTWFKAAILYAPVLFSVLIPPRAFNLPNYLNFLKLKYYWICRVPYIVIYFQYYIVNVINFCNNIYDFQLYNVQNFFGYCFFGLFCYTIQLVYGVFVIKMVMFLSKHTV